MEKKKPSITHKSHINSNWNKRFLKADTEGAETTYVQTEFQILMTRCEK